MRNARSNIAAALLAASIIASSACSQTEVDQSASFVCGEYSVVFPTYFEEGYFAGEINGNQKYTFHLVVKSISEKEYNDAAGLNVVYDYGACNYYSLRLSRVLLAGALLSEIPMRDLYLYLDEAQSMYVYTNDAREVTITARNCEELPSRAVYSGDYYQLNSSYYLWVSTEDGSDEQAAMYKVADL